MASDERKLPSVRDLQLEAFVELEKWTKLRRRQIDLEEELKSVKAELAKLEESPAIQATKGAVRGAKNKLLENVSEEERAKRAKKKNADVRKRLEKKIRQSQNQEKNPNAGKRFPEDTKMA